MRFQRGSVPAHIDRSTSFSSSLATHPKIPSRNVEFPRNNRGKNVLEIRASHCKLSWRRPKGNVGSRSRFFIRLRRPQQDPRKKRRQRRESRESVRAATKVSRRLPRPVASWGPRYRYDVDIWRALLLHPRPVCSLCSLHRQPSLPSK